MGGPTTAKKKSFVGGIPQRLLIQGVKYQNVKSKIDTIRKSKYFSATQILREINIIGIRKQQVEI